MGTAYMATEKSTRKKKEATRKKSRRVKAAAPLPDSTIDEAFQFVAGHGGALYPDRILSSAFANGDLPLWAGDRRVPPRFFAGSLVVVAKPDDTTGRFYAEIEATRALDRPSASSYDWRTSAKAVANFVAGLRVPAKHAGGRPREYSHEDILIIAAVYLQTRCGPQPPTPTELEAAVELILGAGSPSNTQLANILRPLSDQLRAGLDDEMIKSLGLVKGRR